MSLSKEIGDRDFQSYTENVNGETCRRVQGIVGLSDSEGNPVGTEIRNQVRKVLVSDLQNKILLKEVVALLESLNKKLDLIIS